MLKQKALVCGEIFQVFLSLVARCANIQHVEYFFATNDDLLCVCAELKEQAYNNSAKRMRISDSKETQVAHENPLRIIQCLDHVCRCAARKRLRRRRINNKKAVFLLPHIPLQNL